MQYADNLFAENFIKTFSHNGREGEKISELMPEQLHEIEEPGLNYKPFPLKMPSSRQEQYVNIYKQSKGRLTLVPKVTQVGAE